MSERGSRRRQEAAEWGMRNSKVSSLVVLSDSSCHDQDMPLVSLARMPFQKHTPSLISSAVQADWSSLTFVKGNTHCGHMCDTCVLSQQILVCNKITRLSRQLLHEVQKSDACTRLLLSNAPSYSALLLYVQSTDPAVTLFW